MREEGKSNRYRAGIKGGGAVTTRVFKHYHSAESLKLLNINLRIRFGNEWRLRDCVLSKGLDLHSGSKIFK